MITVALFFFLFYAFFLFLFLGIGMNRQWKKERKYVAQSNCIELSELTVIVPFRNEEKRILELLNSIKNSSKLPSKIIFVDDHSEDASVQLIMEHLEGFPIEILTSKSGQFGKKIALRLAINEVKTPFFLTLDADVAFAYNYFQSFEKLEQADMYLLPAVLIAKRWFEPIFEVDILLVNALNTGLSGLKRPIIASGANLLVRKTSFDKFDRFETHAHVPSGDDIYLLRDFRNAKADVRVCTIPKFQVTTETPQSFKEFIHQRMRWIAKTGDVNDYLSTALALFQFVLIVGFFGMLVYLVIAQNYLFAFELLVLKIGIDMLLFLPFFLRFKRMVAWILLPIYQLLFPVYNLFILLLLPFFKPIWKGRIAGVKSNK